MTRMIRFALALVGATILVLAWSGNHATDSQTNQSGILDIENVEIVPVLGSPPLADIPSDVSISLRRLVYDAEGILDIRYTGPVIYLVEQGELAVSYRPDTTMSLLASGSPAQPTSLDTTASGETVLPAGYAIVSEDGQLGRTYNPSEDPTTVLVIMLVPENGDRASESSVQTAAPANEDD